MRHILILSVIFIIIIAGCAPGISSPVSTVSSPQQSLPTSTQWTNTPTPRANLTATSSPLAPVIPQQPRPTIPGPLGKSVDCPAPCLWEIQPGFTTISEARQIFFRADMPFQPPIVKNDKSFFFVTLDPKNGPSTDLTMIPEGDIIHDLEVGIIPEKQQAGTQRNWLAYSPESVISLFGPPSAAEFWADWGPRPVYGMILRYDANDMIIQYTSYDIGGTTGSPRVCPLSDQIDYVRLWIGKNPQYSPYPGVPVEKAASMSMEDFAQLMTGSPSKACFNLNREYFP